MDPARYQIPLVVLPPRQYPWQRLYMTATHSSAGRARAVPITYASGQGNEEVAEDSLAWALRSKYDHQSDLFIDKSTTLKRPGLDKRRCQREQLRMQTQRDTAPVLREEQETEDIQEGRRDFPTLSNSRESQTLASSSTQRSRGPKVVSIRTRESLVNSLLYVHPPTHVLTVPKAKPGYARNPTGAMFTT